jgi:integrase
MLSQARDLASSHGYTVLQAIQEWHSSKGSSKAMPLGEVIEKFLAAKASRSTAYTDKLKADMRQVQSHFGADRPIDRIQSQEIEDFLDAKNATGRGRNNLRSEIITLFRYAQIRLRALHRDRRTEAELVMRDQTKRMPVATFSPEEFESFLGAVRIEWLPWLALGGLAGIRTDGEIFRITWECFQWDRRTIDLTPAMTKMDDRRLVPICDRLFDILQPLRRDSGPVISVKKPEDETARLRRVTGIPWRRNALRHSFCSYRVAITWNIPLVSIESGNSPEMIKSSYWDLKRPDEGFKWFGINLPIPAQRHQEPFLMHLPLTAFAETKIA